MHSLISFAVVKKPHNKWLLEDTYLFLLHVTALKSAVQVDGLTHLCEVLHAVHSFPSYAPIVPWGRCRQTATPSSNAADCLS